MLLKRPVTVLVTGLESSCSGSLRVSSWCSLSVVRWRWSMSRSGTRSQSRTGSSPTVCTTCRSRSPILLWSAHVASFLGSAVWLTGVVAGVAWYLIRRDQHRRAVVLVALGARRGRDQQDDQTDHRPQPTGLRRRPRARRRQQLPVRPRHEPDGRLRHAAHARVLAVGSQPPQTPRRDGAVLVIAIAASRVALGVHYLSDVAAGLLLGLVWVTSLTRPSHRGGAVKRQTTSG